MTDLMPLHKQEGRTIVQATQKGQDCAQAIGPEQNGWLAMQKVQMLNQGR